MTDIAFTVHCKGDVNLVRDLLSEFCHDLQHTHSLRDVYAEMIDGDTYKAERVSGLVWKRGMHAHD